MLARNDKEKHESPHVDRHYYRARFTAISGLHYSHDAFIPFLEEQIKKLEKEFGKKKQGLGKKPD